VKLNQRYTELFGFLFFGLCPSSRMWKWLRLALSDRPNWVGLPCPIHLRTETDPVSETLWSFVNLPHTRPWIESKRCQIVLYNIHHRQNPFKSINQRYVTTWTDGIFTRARAHTWTHPHTEADMYQLLKHSNAPTECISLERFSEEEKQNINKCVSLSPCFI
jgi:hypothetical protein